MKKNLFIIIVLFFSYNVLAQDTIKILQYNLLYYGLTNEYCNSTNNNIIDKTNYLKTIISYTKPDIFAVNEIDDKDNVHDYLLGNVFLLNNFSNYSRAEITHQYLTDQIFYNNTKLSLKNKFEINNSPRIIEVYKFYYNSPNIKNRDTTFLYYILAHLKAGSSVSDSINRIEETNNIMNFVKYKIPENSNIILAGDFNFYNSNEKAYQILTDNIDSTFNFNDPGLIGNWHENIEYSLFHTQSTHYYNNGCAAYGGMDDRFDFILFSNSINKSSNNIGYFPNSFKTIGQDGNHFNQSIDFNSNTSVPSNVLEALANNSDHLPVCISLFINQESTEITKNSIIYNKIVASYQDNYVSIFLNSSDLISQFYRIKIYTITGLCLFNQDIQVTNTNHSLLFKCHLDSGIYIVELKDQNSILKTKIFAN